MVPNSHDDGDLGYNLPVLKDRFADCLLAALSRVCGGHPESLPSKQQVVKSISVPNQDPLNSPEGKPQDLESRICFVLYHQWRNKKENDRRRETITIRSDFGLERSVESPAALASLLILPLEEACKSLPSGFMMGCQIVRNSAGGIGLLSTQRAATLRRFGRLPCPHCPCWPKSEKGLWWHQQRAHQSQHGAAVSVAANAGDTSGAIIVYDPVRPSGVPGIRPKSPLGKSKADSNDIIFDIFRTGDLEAVKGLVADGWDPVHERDRRGASALHWSAGSGHLSLVQYLIKDCQCPINQPQSGKRSFAGRTPLHWASRNGHLHVVRYLAEQAADKHETMAAETGDGTTAFCWASWQGHLEIMKFLFQAGANIHRRNRFGCNAVLWNAQGPSTDLETMLWLFRNGADVLAVNQNGHGILHKASQRQNERLCRWFVDHLLSISAEVDIMALIGPDEEHQCPSDLAGMEGNHELATWLADQECKIALNHVVQGRTKPDWIVSQNAKDTRADPGIAQQNMSWGPRCGVRRMTAHVQFHLDKISG